MSDNKEYALKSDFNVVHLLGPGDALSPSQFVVCLYDRHYWVGIIMEVSSENLDVKVKFMHPKLPAPSFKWPTREDLCWVPNVHICCVTSAPELKSQTARMYYFQKSECDKINNTVALHKKNF